MEETANHFGPFRPSSREENNLSTVKYNEFAPKTTSRLGNGIILTSSMVFGVFMNSLILYLLSKRHILNKSTTTILLHLAASDLIACFVVMPMQFVLFVLNIQPQFLIIAYYVSTNFTVLVDCGCHVLLSVDRCCSVRQARSVGIPAYLFKKILAAIWGIAMANAILTAFTNNGRNPWIFDRTKPLLDAGTIVLYVFIWSALAAVLIALPGVHYTVKKQDQEAGENFGDSSSKKRRQRQIKVLKSTAIAMTSAAILYLPLMLSEYVYRVYDLQSPSTTSFSRILISVSYAINLVIYTGMSKQFRKAAWQEVELHIRRANIRSLLTDKNPERRRKDSKKGTFSNSFVDVKEELNPDDLKDSEKKKESDRGKQTNNDVRLNVSKDEDLFLTKAPSGNNDDMKLQVQ